MTRTDYLTQYKNAYAAKFSQKGDNREETNQGIGQNRQGDGRVQGGDAARGRGSEGASESTTG